MSKQKISAVISTFNSEKFLEKCLKSLIFADEIVVVDDGSTDATLVIAKKFTKNIFHHKSVGYVEPVRNFAISKARGDWILVVDADEEVSKGLAEKLSILAEFESSIVAYNVPRKNIIFGKWIENTGWWPDYQVRFFRKDKVKWSDKIHSSPQIMGKSVSIEDRGNLAIIHNNYQTVSQFLSRMDRYTNIESKELIDKGYKFSWTEILTRPLNEFNSRFFAQNGYKDGMHGLALSLLQSFSILVLHLKVWEKIGFVEVNKNNLLNEIGGVWKKSIQEVRHWIFETLIKEDASLIRKSIYKLKRKLG